jgi:CRISPR type III-A-associated protein Csm2
MTTHRTSPGGSQPEFEVQFHPDKQDVDLLDKHAEKQADAFPDRKLNSNQLRKYFGEIKDLYRQYIAGSPRSDEERQARYQQSFEARFKMIRSKVAYGQRASGQAKVPREFAVMISEGIQRVRPGNHRDFERYVMHLEAVVGFLYGKDKVSK